MYEGKFFQPIDSALSRRTPVMRLVPAVVGVMLAVTLGAVSALVLLVLVRGGFAATTVVLFAAYAFAAGVLIVGVLHCHMRSLARAMAREACTGIADTLSTHGGVIHAPTLARELRVDVAHVCEVRNG